MFCNTVCEKKKAANKGVNKKGEMCWFVFWKKASFRRVSSSLTQDFVSVLPILC